MSVIDLMEPDSSQTIRGAVVGAADERRERERKEEGPSVMLEGMLAEAGCSPMLVEREVM